MMKIIQVTPRYYPYIGGIETHVREICKRLVKKNIDLTIVTTDPSRKLKKEELIEGIEVKRFDSYGPTDSFYFSPGVYFSLKKSNCDILHVHGYHVLSSLFAAFSKASNQTLVFTPHYHGVGHTFFRNILHKLYFLIGARIFDKADCVICVSEYERNLIKKKFKIPDSKLAVIPNGVNLEEFKDIKQVQKNHRTLLYVGRLEEYKGVQHLIKALPQLYDYRLEIIGKGAYKKELKRTAEKFGINSCIDWLEYISRKELLQHYASADVFLMLSKHEAYGITVAEALASGTPCIVATGSALEEFVDGENCIGIEPPITIDKLVRSIKHLEDSRIKGNIQTKNLPIKDWDDIADKLVDVYRGVR